MSEEHLKGAEVDANLKQMRCKTMTQGVRTAAFSDSRFLLCEGVGFLNRRVIERFVGAGPKNRYSRDGYRFQYKRS